MNILAFNLANFKCSIALMLGKQKITLKDSHDFRGQDLMLLPTIQQGLAEHHITFHDLDYIVTGTGPGSFTGIRVALATAQGLSLAAEVPAIGIDSFALYHAKGAPQGLNTVVVLESMRYELYIQEYDVSGAKSGPALCLNPGELSALYNTLDYRIVGDAVTRLSPGNWTLQPLDITAEDLIDYSLTLQDFKAYPCLPYYVRDADTTKPA
jgi:universal bacterial protein YeaZ